jgi:hypothetical protein
MRLSPNRSVAAAPTSGSMPPLDRNRMKLLPLEIAGVILGIIGLGQGWKSPRGGAALMVAGGVLFGIGYAERGGTATLLGWSWALLVPLFAYFRYRVRNRDTRRAREAREILARIQHRDGEEPPR